MARISAFVEPAAARPNNSKEDTQIGIYRYLWGWQCGRREYEFVMKQTVIDILIYLFEHYIDDDIELDADRDELKSELRDAGFEAGQVAKAFEWLQELAVTRDHADDFPTPAQTSFRIFTVEEQRKLDAECRGFLHFLSQSAVLDSARRELVIDRVLALEIGRNRHRATEMDHPYGPV